MKSVLPWLVALALLGAAAFFYSSNRKLAAEAAALRAESAQTEFLRAEVEQLKQTGSPAQADEMARLRKQAEEVLKLRNEVQQLRGEKKDLTQRAQQAQTQAQAAQAQVQAVQSQVQSLSTNLQAAQALTAQQQAQAAFAARYGIQPGTLSPEQMVNACINSLRQMDGAKQQWALEHKKTINDTPSEKEVGAYLRGGAVPKCLGGGTYTLGAVGVEPTCTIAGHALPQ